MREDCCLGDKRRIHALDDHHRRGCFHGFEKQGIAGGAATLCRAGVVDAVIEADGKGRGFMGRRNELCEHGAIPWTGTELFFATGISRHDGERRLTGIGDR